MKIRKLQSGGIYYTPYFRGSTESQFAQPVQNQNNNTDNSLIDKEIISLIHQNGLQNDVDYFLNQANSFLSKSQNLGGPFLNGSKSYNMSDLINLSSLANKISRNQSLYTNAQEQIRSEESGSEVAITSTGKLYVADDKGIKTIDPNTYFNNQDKYQLLTNSDLLHYREVIPNLAFNSSMLIDLANTTSMKSIMEYVKSTISAFGTTKNSEKFDRYTTKQQGLIQEGFENLLGLAPDGTYKVNTDKSIEYKGSGDVKAAINYLYSTLPNNMKNALKAKTASLGLDPTKINNVTNILEQAIREHTGTSTSTSISLTPVSTDKNSGNKSGSGSSSTSLTEMPFNLLVQRDGGQPRDTNLIFNDSNLNFNIPAYYYNNQDTNKMALPDVVTLSEITSNYINNSLKDPYSKVYFAGKPIDTTIDGRNIIIDTQKGMAVAYLPINESGNIDMSVLKTMSSIQNQIQQNHITDKNKIREIWNDNGFEYEEDKNVGKVPGMTLKRFIIHSGYTSKNGNLNKEIFKNNDLITKIDSDIINNLIGIYNNDPNNKDKQKLDFEPGMFGNGYKGLIFIPLNDNENEVGVSGGTVYTPKMDSDTIKLRQDIARQNGAYDPISGTYNRNLNGTTANSLD